LISVGYPNGSSISSLTAAISYEAPIWLGFVGFIALSGGVDLDIF